MIAQTPTQPESSPSGITAPVLDWIDRELADTYSARRRSGGNKLLELRQSFQKANPNRSISLFYRQLPGLESTHFLLGYRIRKWIALNFEIQVYDPLARVSERTYPIRFCDTTLASPKYHFFEHAEETIPLSDIRVQIQPKALNSRTL